MVKITSRALKIGVQSRFYPISTVGFRTFCPENFGQAYCPWSLVVYIWPLGGRWVHLYTFSHLVQGNQIYFQELLP